MFQFKDFGVSTEVLEGIRLLSYSEPTEIQREAIPIVLSGRDLVAQAQTGTGKTSAFGIPLTEGVSPKIKKTQALIIVPTRELALQVTEELKALGRFKRLFVLSVYGGKPIDKQVSFLKKGLCHIVVGTPGRLKDLLQRGSLDLGNIKYLVLDEADRMLEMGFIEDIEEIIQAIPDTRQTLLFSATLPGEILKMAERFLRSDYARIRIKPQEPTVDTITQKIYKTSEGGRFEKLVKLLKVAGDTKTIVFTHTKREAEELAQELREMGFSVSALHGDYSQRKRESVLKGFREGRFDILVATDVASRGLDIKDVELVINYGLPKDSDSYIHRIGRTGRAGRRGTAISLMIPREERHLRAILYRTKGKIEICRD
jgi:ATP-dependent RNA helicase DeaD